LACLQSDQFFAGRRVNSDHIVELSLGGSHLHRYTKAYACNPRKRARSTHTHTGKREMMSEYIDDDMYTTEQEHERRCVRVYVYVCMCTRVAERVCICEREDNVTKTHTHPSIGPRTLQHLIHTDANHVKTYHPLLGAGAHKLHGGASLVFAHRVEHVDKLGLVDLPSAKAVVREYQRWLPD
jgi:hypothetical protein